MSHLSKVLEKLTDNWFDEIIAYKPGQLSEAEVALEAIPRDEVAEFIEMASNIQGKPFPLSKVPSVTQIDYIIQLIQKYRSDIDKDKFRTQFPTIVKNISLLIQARKK